MANEPEPGQDPLVSVIMPARNEEKSIGAALDSACNQTYRNLQIIVVDGASTDRTAEIIKHRMVDDPRIELVRNPRAHIPSSLNLALAVARGTFLVRIDAHSTVTTTYVAQLVEHLRHARWGGVGGRKDGVGITAAGRAIAAAMGSRFGVGNSKYHYITEVEEVDHLPFGAYPVDLLRELGGWDETLVANEDFELDYRIRRSGRTLLLDPNIVIKWQCRQSIPDLYRQYARYGSGKADVAFLHPSSMQARHLAAPALVLWLGLAALIGLRRPKYGLLMASPYLAGVTVASLQTAGRLDVATDRKYVPAAFVAMHVGWGLGFWRQTIARLTRRR
ncbi:glycosyltransferase family 2 protein [Mycolicibacterium sp. CH28]|uniref:glycosyltransferase family 2 protein n=1 Tax=Mycolicibacterium sp. CH28 TaxID=2512237 RepID=UPI0010816F7A|nr:glycosyltransferase family 2 protein [Mycolicibacterium sp. CH28]TGD88953.1 glycosyltransferase family 2 protein [Mycolicibacterium sp. CH28]